MFVIAYGFVARVLAGPKIYDDFVSGLIDILRATGFDAGRLILEMTETVMLHDTATTIARLAELGITQRDVGDAVRTRVGARFPAVRIARPDLFTPLCQ